MSRTSRLSRKALIVLVAVVVALAAGITIWAKGFNAYTSYTAGTQPHFVAIGDLNNDGNPDLVSANYASNSVSVLLGNSNGTFQTAQNYTAGSFPIAVAVADLNNDGNLDVVVANNNNNQPGGNLMVMFGNGNGTLQTPVTYSVQGGPFFVAIADLNGDNLPDVVLAAHGAPVQVFLDTSNGTLQSPGTYNAGANPQSVAIADFNGDGIPDLAVANSGSKNVSILLGKGDGTFQPAVNYAVGTAPSVVATGDFNADGHVDLAVTNNGSNNVSILLGNGDGTFQTQTTIATSAGPSGLVVTDIDGDSTADLVVTNQYDTSNTIQTFLGNGDGTFQNPTSYPAGDLPRIVATGDFNHDGAPDLAVACSQGGISVFLNNGGTHVTDVGNPNPANPLQPVTFTATVTPSLAGLGTPTGTVSFYNGTTLLGTGTLNSSGVASYTDSSGFAAGTYQIYANYSGDTNYNPNSAPLLTETVSTGGPNVVLNPTSLSFPAQLVNTTSTAQNVSLMNTGTGTLTITSIAATGDFHETNTCGSSVQGGGSCTISVTFTPTSTGSLKGKVSITDNASGSPQTVSLSGIGTALSISPTSLNFGNQAVHTTSQPQVVTVMNHSTASVTFSNIRFASGDPLDFAETNTCSPTLAGNSSCTISITFTPHATGARSSTLEIFDTGGGSPQKVTVSGTGT